MNFNKKRLLESALKARANPDALNPFPLFPRRTKPENEPDPYDFGQGLFDPCPTKNLDKLHQFMNDVKNMDLSIESTLILFFPPDYRSTSANGKPCTHTSQVLENSVKMLKAAGFELDLVFNDTIPVPFGNNWYKDKPVGATLRNSNGDVILVYQFFEYPFATNWPDGVYEGKHATEFLALGDLLLALKCSYAVVDDGYSCQTLGLNPDDNKDLSEFKPREMFSGKWQCPSPEFGYYHCCWMLKALENYEIHREKWERYNP